MMPAINGRLLALAFVAALILPAVLVLLGPSPSATFLLYASGFIGLASLMMLSIQFTTSGRFERIAAPLGLDVLMGFHRLAGRAVIFAIAAHVLLSVGLAGSGRPAEIPGAVARLITSERLTTGFVGLGLLFALVWSAARRDRLWLRYEWWRLSHGLGALALLLIAAHHAWTNAIFLRSGSVAALVGLAILSAFASFGVIYIVRAFKARNPDWTVEAVRPLGSGFHEVTLSTSGSNVFNFRAGQFAWVTFGRHHPVTDHPFSIASAPGELPKLRFIIKENGDFTGAIGTMKPGTPAYLDAPHGNFVVDPQAKSIVLIAGGVGIAPILSILRWLAADRYRGPVALLVAMRHDLGQLLTTQEMEEIARRLDLTVMLVVEQPSATWEHERGRIDEQKLTRLLSDFPVASAEILMCGPLPMIERVSELLLRVGARPDQIQYERFDYHAGSDPKSRIVRRRTQLVLAIALSLLVGAAVAGAYFS